jgi:putative hemolysin
MAIGTDIFFLVILLVLSGFFSSSEVALLSLSKSRVQHMVEKKRTAATYIKKLKDNTQRMLSTILIGNNLANVAASAIATSIAIDMFKSFAIGIATGVMTLLILVFGEITPKSIAARNNEAVAQFVALPIWYMSIVLAPIITILDKFLNKFIGMMGIKSKESAITEEEIISMVKTAEEEGSIMEMEEKMIKSILEFDDKSVSEVATPRRDMVMIESKVSVIDAFNVFMKKNHTRIPIFNKSRDNVIGIVHIKDLMKQIHGPDKKNPISSIMYKPYFVPETKKLSDLLRHFQKRKEHLAVVVDEHGSITGLVTLEDILEEIVGEIMDETDLIAPNIINEGANMWIVKGKTGIDEINEKLNMGLKGKDYDTLSGFILQRTGKIPNEKDTVDYNDFRIIVENIENNRISKVKIEKRI